MKIDKPKDRIFGFNAVRITDPLSVRTSWLSLERVAPAIRPVRVTHAHVRMTTTDGRLNWHVRPTIDPVDRANPDRRQCPSAGSVHSVDCCCVRVTDDFPQKDPPVPRWPGGTRPLRMRTSHFYVEKKNPYLPRERVKFQPVKNKNVDRIGAFLCRSATLITA